MKAIITSDLHGILPKIEKEFDLLIIGGDVCPVVDHSRQRQFNWLCYEFADWVRALPFKNADSRVVLIAGNHDFVLESIEKPKLNSILSASGGRLVYLDNEEYDFECMEEEGLVTYRIFGCPYCKVFGNWAFMRENLDKYYSPIPEKLDILITHDAPGVDGYGVITQGWHKGVDAGNHLLADYIEKVKPTCAFHGHIHSSPHEIKLIKGTFYGNVSLVDENYDETYPPLEIELIKRTERDEWGTDKTVTSFRILNKTE